MLGEKSDSGRRYHISLHVDTRLKHKGMEEGLESRMGLRERGREGGERIRENRWDKHITLPISSRV